MTKLAAVIRHVHFEHLGSFLAVLETHGYSVRWYEAGQDDLIDVDRQEPDLLIVLGAPIGAYEEHAYPFLSDELLVLERRLKHERPTLGICLGAQLMARALGERVYPGSSKEIGWSRLTLTADGLRSPLRHLTDAAVLHWHGDTFDLPRGARLLASTAAYPNQAFAIGTHTLALQCHAEANGEEIERWLIGHACELAQAKVNPAVIRGQARFQAAGLARASRKFFGEWLDGLAEDDRR